MRAQPGAKVPFFSLTPAAMVHGWTEVCRGYSQGAGSRGWPRCEEAALYPSTHCPQFPLGPSSTPPAVQGSCFQGGEEGGVGKEACLQGSGGLCDWSRSLL